MSNIAYGFRPESGWSGVLFQVILQGPIVEQWRKQKEIEGWIFFNGQGTPCALHEMISEVAMPDIGFKRLVLQCIVPDIKVTGSQCPVTLNAYGAGNKSLVQGLYLGTFTFRPNSNHPI
jgi:hypothetical protein